MKPRAETPYSRPARRRLRQREALVAKVRGMIARTLVNPVPPHGIGDALTLRQLRAYCHLVAVECATERRALALERRGWWSR